MWDLSMNLLQVAKSHEKTDIVLANPEHYEAVWHFWESAGLRSLFLPVSKPALPIKDWEMGSLPGGALTYNNDGGAPTDASNQGAIGDNFLAKRWVIG